MDPDPPARISDVTGVILAGGRSLRYGRNKALVRLRDVPLIERVIGVLAGVFQRIVLITNTPEDFAYLDLPMHEDRIRGLGPIGGIHAALSVIPTEWGFFTACDMPFLCAGLIRHLASLKESCDAVVPVVGGNLETLHALYHRRCGRAIEERIAAGDYQLIRFFPQVAVRTVEERVLRSFDPALRCFLNINEPGQLHDLERRGAL